MTQISPTQISQYQTPAQPNYNAVKIDINNPQVNAGQTPGQPATSPMYSYPKAPVYEVPKQSIYKPEQKPANQPSAVKEAPTVPAPVLVQPPVAKEIAPATAAPVAPKAEEKPAPAAPKAEEAPVEPKKIEVKAPESNTPRPEN